MTKPLLHAPAMDLNSGTKRRKTIRIEEQDICIKMDKLNFFYGASQVLHDIDMRIPRKKVTAYIGPSGCGKSTLLRCINRMNDLVDNARIDGQILLGGENIYDKAINVTDLRRRVGMVFQKPNPFPKSIYENVAYGLRIQGVNDRKTLDESIENALEPVGQ
ncbi:MAG: hypothetical protein CVV06_16190 [Gammaproteobacteria bacterium HGW-Gammaproteobacteria-10]|nr:MAG: hypothetical protein CVV13_13400 [Gammaproteobacteria bacterium HGW-Gammaproteobacteria-3]PKM35453.1 MAG: hypothetical protein CVV06_16190 [Gammaproteobacteria bacterium HGW-Gammaproteobacteria-10]